jgi:2-oxo-4-hydroxy-4-carboxy-5-ureidoimidazoline decarboxylase
MDLATLNACDADAFVRVVAPVFEGTPVLAERLAVLRPFADRGALIAAAGAVIRAMDAPARLAYICAHPELAGAAARLGRVAAHSAAEQGATELDRLDAAEQARFDAGNAAYRARFGFPFIAAVRLHTRQSLLAAFERRLQNDRETELGQAVEEICRIVGLRLEALLF